MLLRVGRRKAAWESRDTDHVSEVEFRTPEGEPDLRVSVYELSAAYAVQVLAEHAAAAGLDPPRGGLVLQVSDLPSAAPVATPGLPLFSTTRESHRELPFEDAAALRAFVAALIDDLDARSIQVSKQQLSGYVAERLRAKDPEWVAFCATAPRATGWRKLDRQEPAA